MGGVLYAGRGLQKFARNKYWMSSMQSDLYPAINTTYLWCHAIREDWVRPGVLMFRFIVHDAEVSSIIKRTSDRLSLSTQLIVSGVIWKSIEKENQSESLCITACGTMVHSTGTGARPRAAWFDWVSRVAQSREETQPAESEPHTCAAC